MDSTIIAALVTAAATIIAALLNRGKVVSYRVEGKEREYNLGALLFLILAFFGGGTLLALMAYRLFTGPWGVNDPMGPIFRDVAVFLIFAATSFFGGLACAAYIDPRLEDQVRFWTVDTKESSPPRA